MSACISDDVCLDNPIGYPRPDNEADGQRAYHRDVDQNSDPDAFREKYLGEPVAVAVQTSSGDTYAGRAELHTYPGADEACGSCTQLSAFVGVTSQA